MRVFFRKALSRVYRKLGGELHVQGSSARFAYVFYATNNIYAVAVMVAARALMRLEGRNDVDFVVLHHNVDRFILRRLREMGVFTKQVRPVPFAKDGYFVNSLTKLRVLQLTQYETAVFMDADSLPLKRLDDLFVSDWPGAIAAPTAYWFPDKAVTSALFAFRPSADLWARVSRHFASARARQLFDMDIINLEFAGDVKFLPGEYLCLNTEYGDQTRPTFFGDPDVSYDQVRVVHFSDLGKPWFYRPHVVRDMRPNAHPQFYLACEDWWRLRDQVVSGGTLEDRMLFGLLENMSLR